MAEKFADKACTVCLVARNQNRLEQTRNAIIKDFNLPSDRVHSKVCDISNETELDELCKYLKNEMGGVDVWINNAACSSITVHF